MRRAVLPVALAACAWLAACSDGTGPDGSRVPAERVELGATGESPTILQQSADAPELETYSKSVRACYGEPVELRISYESGGGGEPGQFLGLRVPSLGLWKNPKGTFFQPGDCVSIKVSVDSEYLLAEFHPAGLQFNPAAPATLALSYAEADPDFDQDGYVGPNDYRIERQELDVWRLPHEDDGWEKLDALQYVGDKKFEAQLLSFSHYAVAH